MLHPLGCCEGHLGVFAHMFKMALLGCYVYVVLALLYCFVTPFGGAVRGTFSDDFKKYLFSSFVEVKFCHEGGVTFN